MTLFLRLLDASVEDKPALLRAAIQETSHVDPARRRGVTFDVELASFALVPGSPFAYWVSERVRNIFRLAEPLNSHKRLVVSTNPLNDDFRYVRAWWEVAQQGPGRSWRPWAKGGAYSPIYYDIDTIISWDDRRATYWGFLGTETRQRERPVASVQHFFRAGITWPRRTNGLSLRLMTKGSIFADKGPAIFVENDDTDELLALASVTNSRVFGLLVSLQLARTELAQSYEVGLIQQTPVPVFSDEDRDVLSTLARRVWKLRRAMDTTRETSHAFVLPSHLNETVTGLDRTAIDRELVEIQRDIDERAFGLYGIAGDDRLAIESGLSAGPTQDEGGRSGAEAPAADHDEDGIEPEDGMMAIPVLPTYSWLVGVAFGRFDKRLATGYRPIPPEPEPFDPLPLRSPGMWPAEEAREVPPAILVDDPGHERDLAAHVRSAAADTGLDVGQDLRGWLGHEFFALHIKMYTKSRRRAPIYWQLATPTASYSVWLYLHGFTRDSLYRVLNDFVSPKLAHEERKVADLARRAAGASAGERKQLAEQEDFVNELRAFRDEVARVAPLWNPNLDDGVIINFAPLWRLVPQYRSWERECKAAWDRLAAGDYDWSHLAMHLWPERVVPKCAENRSLAISHGLERVFWTESEDGKWQARPVERAIVDELIRARTSIAVKDALKSLLGAPTSTAVRGGRGKKVTRAAARRRRRATPSPPDSVGPECNRGGTGA